MREINGGEKDTQMRDQEMLDAIVQGMAMPTMSALSSAPLSYEIREALMIFLEDRYDRLNNDEKKQFEEGLQHYREHTKEWQQEWETRLKESRSNGNKKGLGFLVAGSGLMAFAARYDLGINPAALGLVLATAGIWELISPSTGAGIPERDLKKRDNPIYKMKRKGELAALIERKLKVNS